MTGFAHTEGVVDGLAWAWELRSVNGRGLELRFRLPPGLDALEPTLREAAGKQLKRGNVTANLTVKRDEQPRLAPDPAALEQVLALAIELAARIPGARAPARRGAAGAARRVAPVRRRRGRKRCRRPRGRHARRASPTRWRPGRLPSGRGCAARAHAPPPAR